MSKIVEFKGIPSGDYEGFCWDVTEEEFIKIMGEKPSEYDRSIHNKGLYRLYPNAFYSYKDKNVCTTTIKIKY